MNQENVKENLLKIDSEVSDFALIFSGKESRKVDGLYHPETQEIIIHNKNFEDGNSLMYTAIHEFAHHIQFTRHEKEVKKRAHTPLFWDIFHKLLNRAEELGIFQNIFTTDPKFVELTREIKEKFLIRNGELMKDFGKYLINALDLCQQKHAIFEDYLDRSLGISRTLGKAIMKVYALDIDPSIGFENMKIVSGITDSRIRSESEQSFREGMSQSEVKQGIKDQKRSKESFDSISRLESQKRRIERSIEELQLKLEEVQTKIESMTTEGEG